MKIFDLKNKSLNSNTGEYVLGFQDTGSHACYMIYGVLKPQEKGRLINPGKGHEEVVLAVKGNLTVTGKFLGNLREGSAFHVKGNQKCFLENLGENDAVYVIAGGHSEDGHH